MEDSMSITKDKGEYYIYLKDNSNLIANGYKKKGLIKKVATETIKSIWMGYIYQLKVFTKIWLKWIKRFNSE